MNETIKKALEHRQTVKAYQEKAIPAEDWKQILDTIYFAPTSHGFEPYRVLVIDHKNQALREELKPVMWNQGTITTADKLVLFISLKREVWYDHDWLFKRALRRATDVMGKSGDEANKIAEGHVQLVLNTHLGPDEKNDDWAMKQAYIALGMSMYTASILNIGSSPMEGFERAKIGEVLKKHNLINDNELVAVTVAFGYPNDEKSYGHWGTGKRVHDKWEVKFKEI